MDGLPDRRAVGELDPAGCYFHPDRPSRYQCCWCGRTLCLDSLRRVEGADYCPECDPDALRPVFICGCCGTITFDPAAACAGCGQPDRLRPRRPVSGDTVWEVQAEGPGRDARFEAFALTWVAVFIGGLIAGAFLPLHGVPLSTAWWSILFLACCASATMAERVSLRRNRYRLFLSAQGIWVQARGKSTDLLNWNEITRLEWVPPSAPRHLTLHAGDRRIELNARLRDWEMAIAVIRQHAPLVPPPTTRQCQRRPRTPR